MGKLYRLSPTAFQAFAYTCIGLAVLVVLLFLVDKIKRHILQIQKHRVEEAARAVEDAPVDAPITAEEAHANHATATIGFRDAYLAATVQTVSFCLWNVLVHCSMMNYIEIPVWPSHMILIGLIYAGMAWMDHRYPRQKTEATIQKQCRSDLMLVGLILAFFATQFFLVSAQACWNVAPFAVYDYYGPVRVVGYNASRIGRDGKNNLLVTLRKHYFKCPIDEAVGQIQVAWGGTWACPTHGADHECSVSIHSYHCDFSVCEDCHGGCTPQEYESILGASNHCVQNGTLAGFTDSWDLMAEGINYDPSVPPMDDAHQYSTVQMYADCNACQAEFAEIVEEHTESNLKWVSVFFGIVSGLSAIAYYALVMAAQRKKEDVTAEADRHVVEAGVEQS